MATASTSFTALSRATPRPAGHHAPIRRRRAFREDKEVVPSAGLRRWFGHDPARWPGFQDRYQAELAGNAALDELFAMTKQGRPATLLFGARDTEHNNAVVLQALCKRG